MASTATTTQINVRIDRALKSSGDAALFDAGITPSEAIRAVWELGVRLKDSPQALRAALCPRSAEAVGEEVRRRAAVAASARAGQEIVPPARCAAGISEETCRAVSASSEDDELYGEALYDRYAGRWSL